VGFCLALHALRLFGTETKPRGGAAFQESGAALTGLLGPGLDAPKSLRYLRYLMGADGTAGDDLLHVQLRNTAIESPSIAAEDLGGLPGSL